VLSTGKIAVVFSLTTGVVLGIDIAATQSAKMDTKNKNFLIG
jgi:hypothetical protein